MSKLKTPREKKLASLALDCRNTYGENYKAARQSIPRGKRRASKAVRRAATEVLPQVQSGMDEDDITFLEATAKDRELAERRGGFRKHSDVPLGNIIKSQLAGGTRYTSTRRFTTTHSVGLNHYES